ncbi:integrase catalytic domain-containing protein [Trichonephila clavipes]|nr:integrase catalytic domain-containing protein [Trichonephila clavipes]
MYKGNAIKIVIEKGGASIESLRSTAFDPFLDENSLLRVGGRLSNADLPFEAKHQIIIPSKHKFTKLLFEHVHKKFFHIGAQGLVHQIRMQFWPINGKGIARKTVHDCIACFRQKPTGVDQIMGNLPSERVTPSALFLNSGVDFCGPFQIKFKNQRKGIFSKVYVAIFVYLATKPIHLEAVTDLTTEAFIAALKRLCARRGRISTLMSDNATNFKGTAAELNPFIKLIFNKNETLANYFASEAIQWKFIPPRSPNFGGLWEAGVKSFKHHLYRTLVNSKITFEEFETIIIQTEGILNPRPLVPLSDNINEYDVLTPGHFIIGRPISAIPEPAILDISDNRLSRWQYTTKCVQTIWKRWKNDYLNHLQQRNKWQFEKINVAVGCLELLKENDLPPCKWAMAKILEVIYGTDGLGKLRCPLAKPVRRHCDNPSLGVPSLHLRDLDLWELQRALSIVSDIEKFELLRCKLLTGRFHRFLELSIKDDITPADMDTFCSHLNELKLDMKKLFEGILKEKVEKLFYHKYRMHHKY